MKVLESIANILGFLLNALFAIPIFLIYLLFLLFKAAPAYSAISHNHKAREALRFTPGYLFVTFSMIVIVMILGTIGIALC